MSDEVYRPQKGTDDAPQQKPQALPSHASSEAGVKITGQMPKEFQQALEARRQTSTDPASSPQPTSNQARPTEPKIRLQGSQELESLLQQLADKHIWEDFTFPSMGKFYDSIPNTIQVRAMTGEEEQILATPRYVRRGKAIDMIFEKCIKESFDTSQLLSIDRNHLLIYLRGISYTPEYDVEIKCPACSTSFSTPINLDTLEVDLCPEEFTKDSLQGVLPSSGFRFGYRLSTGADEQAVTVYREKRIKAFGTQSDDDTLLFRTALLLEHVEGVTDKKELATLLKKLSVNDVSHLRNEINEPPFGVQTDVPMCCPSCTSEFDIELPLDTNFFFPRKKTKIQA